MREILEYGVTVFINIDLCNVTVLLLQSTSRFLKAYPKEALTYMGQRHVNLQALLDHGNKLHITKLLSM